MIHLLMCYHEIGRCPVTRGGCVEHVALIAEGGVVRVLHDSHELNAVVTVAHDARKDRVLEIGVRRDGGLFPGHSNVTFVDAQTRCVQKTRWLTIGDLEGVVMSSEIPVNADVTLRVSPLLLQWNGT